MLCILQLHKTRSRVDRARQTFAVASELCTRIDAVIARCLCRCGFINHELSARLQMEHGRNMFGPSSYSSFQSFYGAPSFGQPQSQVGPCGAADMTPFPTVSDVFYGGGDGGPAATGSQRLGYSVYDSLQPADTDFQPPYFPPPNPAAAQPVGGAGLFAHHRQVPVTQQPLQPVVDQSMYWSPINAAAVYTTGATSANIHAANVDQQKTYHALQQVQV